MMQPTPLSHQAARLSVIGAFVCFATNCVTNQLIWKHAAGQAALLNTVVGTLTSGIVLAGIGLGVAGLIGGWKRKSSDTAGIAAIGLALNLGIVLVTVWLLLMLRSRQ